MRNTIKVNNHRLISRSDLAAIADMIPHGAKILDLGCGSGRLLKALKMLKDAKIMGVELDQGKIIECVRRGVPVIQSNLDGALPEFMDNSYDYVILSRTLQAVMHPDLLLAEMLRIGNKGIISLMNFAHFDARLQMMGEDYENGVRGLRFASGYAMRLSGYSSAYHAGDISGRQTVGDIKREG